MTEEKMRQLLNDGEGFTVEYKECQKKLSSSVYETVCSFSNRYGGHLLLGVEEIEKNGKKVGHAIGVDRNAVYDMKRNFLTALNNANKFKPCLYLNLEEFEYQGKMILWTYVPASSNLCFVDGKIFDRNGESDQDITNSAIRIEEIVNRKSAEYAERKIFPFITEEHLKLELLEPVKKMAQEDSNHPWHNMDDREIMMSAGLYIVDFQTGQKGYNLAAVLLFGKKEVIASCVPGYKTDAIYRVENLDRYDDRLIVDCNLVEAYDKLMEFIAKHTDDKFFLENNVRVSVRNRIAREICSNILIHRDFTSAFPAKLIIEKDKIKTENWSKSKFNGKLDIKEFNPYPKNPLLAGFFHNIGRADTLGSGMRNLYKYSKIYSGTEPELVEGDIFRIEVSLNQADRKEGRKREERGKKEGRKREERGKKSPIESAEIGAKIIELVSENKYITISELASILNVSHSTIEREIKKLKSTGRLKRRGSTKAGYWEILF